MDVGLKESPIQPHAWMVHGRYQQYNLIHGCWTEGVTSFMDVGLKESPIQPHAWMVHGRYQQYNLIHGWPMARVTKTTSGMVGAQQESPPCL